jgi:hypothetical protein
VLRRNALLLTVSAALWFLSSPPAYGHGCGHHSGCGSLSWRDHGCYGCGSWSGGSRWSNPQTISPASAETHDGKIAEVIYLPGANPDTAMVELRLLSGSATIPVRLGPAGFLKQNQLNLKEGDAITVTGYRISTGDGDLLVATKINKQGKTVRLRDRWGRSGW